MAENLTSKELVDQLLHIHSEGGRLGRLQIGDLFFEIERLQQRVAELEHALDGKDGWRANAKYLLDNYPGRMLWEDTEHPDFLLTSLVITFQKMQSELARYESGRCAMVSEIQGLRQRVADADANAPWLTVAHILCSDMGIVPGHIHDRMNALRVRLQVPPVAALRDALEAIASPSRHEDYGWWTQVARRALGYATRNETAQPPDDVLQKIRDARRLWSVSCRCGCSECAGFDLKLVRLLGLSVTKEPIRVEPHPECKKCERFTDQCVCTTDETDACRIYEYDGAFKCYTHNRLWGAVSNPSQPCAGWKPESEGDSHV